MRNKRACRPGFCRRRRLVHKVVLFVFWIVPAVALPQTTGKIEGVVVDQGNAPLAGATVELAGPRLQGMRSTVTSPTGAYRFLSVPTGAYTITASLPALGKVQKTASVSPDGTATVLLQLNLTASAEVTVLGEAPLVDSTATTTGSNYSAKAISKLPIGRNYADVVFMQPGVQTDFGETEGRNLSISMYGSTSAENLFLIDGINTTNVVKGIQGKDINPEFIEEVEVKTGGYQAEYGRNTGGVINVITKSGGNEFHGGVFGYYNDTGMRAEPANGKSDNYDTPIYSQTGDAQFANYIHSKDVRQELGLNLGGYVWKDRVWFFGAYDRININQNLQPLDVNNHETFGKEFPNSYVQTKYAGKLTLNPLPSTTVVGSIFSDAQTQQGAVIEPPPTSLDPNSYSGRRDTGGPDYGVRANQLFGSFGIFGFQWAHHDDRFGTTPLNTTLVAIRDFTVSPAGDSYRQTGGFGNVFGPVDNNSSNRNAYAASFAAWLGNMEIKVGGDYTSDATSGASYNTGGSLLRIRPCLQDGANFCDLSQAPVNTNPGGVPVPVYYQHNYYVTGTQSDHQFAATAPFSISTKRWSIYLQDEWKIVPNLTVNAGVRYDSESYNGVTATGAFTAFTLPNQWAPRVGFAWDFARDGSSKLFGSVGRFFYSLPNDINVRAFTDTASTITYNYDPNRLVQGSASVCDGDTVTTACVPRGEGFQGGTATGEPVDAGTKASYQDELTLGIEKALTPTLSVGLKGTYRKLGRAVEDRCDLDYNVGDGNTCGIMNPGGSGPVASGSYGLCNESGNTTDPTAGQCGLSNIPIGPAKRTFRGIEVIAREQFSSNFWAQASFLYSSLKGNYSGAIMETTGQTDPGINADFDYYQFQYHDYGRMELDRPVQARLDAFYDSPLGLWAGMSFYVRSGRPTNVLGWYNGFYLNQLFLVDRGTAGRLPTDYDLNLSLGYDLNIGPVTITPILYFFNLLNRQTPNDVLQNFNESGAYVINPDSPFYGQSGVEPGTTDACPASSPAPCTDTPDYRKVTQRTAPRSFRVAVRVTF